jgi:hypothetical protein
MDPQLSLFHPLTHSFIIRSFIRSLFKYQFYRTNNCNHTNSLICHSLRVQNSKYLWWKKRKIYAIYLAGVNPGKLMRGVSILCLNNLFFKAASVKHKTKTPINKLFRYVPRTFLERTHWLFRHFGTYLLENKTL